MDLPFRSRLFNAFASHPRPVTADQIARSGLDAGSEDLGEKLARLTVAEVSVQDVNGLFEGNLWALSDDAFTYFLPALMYLALENYASVSVLSSELIGALTKPSRDDVVTSLDRLERSQDVARRNEPALDLLRQQQLEWFDSGTPSAIFDSRVADLAASEGSAILDFLERFRDRHGADFPFDELDVAIDRYWAKYRSS